MRCNECYYYAPDNYIYGFCQYPNEKWYRKAKREKVVIYDEDACEHFDAFARNREVIEEDIE